MGAVIGELLPYAVAASVSPLPISAVILILLGTRARTSSLGFASGWLIGLLAVTTVVAWVGSTASAEDGRTASWIGWVKLILGLALFAEGVREWLARKGSSGTPTWMAKIDTMGPLSSASLAFVLSAVNPKNLMMSVAAGITVAGARLSTADSAIAVLVYVVLAGATVTVPVLGYQVAAGSLDAPLRRTSDWLKLHNRAVMAVLIVIVGAVLVGKGIGNLT